MSLLKNKQQQQQQQKNSKFCEKMVYASGRKNVKLKIFPKVNSYLQYLKNINFVDVQNLLAINRSNHENKSTMIFLN